MSALIDIWPKGVGYDKWSGYNAETYDLKKDQIQRVQLLVDAWKATALNHGFLSENIRKLSCLPCDNGHQLTFLNASSELVALKSQVQTMEVSVDVDQDPDDTHVAIKIFGKNLAKAKDFSFYLSVYRYPTVRVHTRYEDLAPKPEVT